MPQPSRPIVGGASAVADPRRSCAPPRHCPAGFFARVPGHGPGGPAAHDSSADGATNDECSDGAADDGAAK